MGMSPYNGTFFDSFCWILRQADFTWSRPHCWEHNPSQNPIPSPSAIEIPNPFCPSS